MRSPSPNRRLAAFAAVGLILLLVALAATDRPAELSGEALGQVTPTDVEFGFNSRLYNDHPSYPRREADLAARAGATVHRLPIHWRGLQRNPGAPPLPDEGGKPLGGLSNRDSGLYKLDRFYLELRSRGIAPILIAVDAPVWASRYARCASQRLNWRCQSAIKNGRLFPDEAHVDDYARFVAAVASRYPEAIIEPWNEPNLYFGRSEAAATPELMAKMQCAAHAAVKRAAGNVVTSPGFSDRRFAEYVGGMMAAGAHRCWEAFSKHLYFGSDMRHGDGSQLAREMSTARQVRAQYGDRSPIWVTELGYTTSGPFAVSERDQFEGLTEVYDRLVAAGDVEMVVVHTLRDAPGVEYSDRRHAEYGYGLLRENWAPKPAYCHFVRQAGKRHPGC